MSKQEQSIPQKFFERAKTHPDLTLFLNKEKGRW